MAFLTWPICNIKQSTQESHMHEKQAMCLLFDGFQMDNPRNISNTTNILIYFILLSFQHDLSIQRNNSLNHDSQTIDFWWLTTNAKYIIGIFLNYEPQIIDCVSKDLS